MATSTEKLRKEDKTRRTSEVRSNDRAKGRSSAAKLVDAPKTKPEKPMSARNRLLQLVRGNEKMLKALGLGEAPSDEMLMKALEGKDLELLLLDEGVKAEHAALVAKLHKEAKKELARRGSRTLKKLWKIVLQLLLVLAALTALAALVSFIMNMGWELSNCSIQEFTNRTCNQGNGCKLQVMVSTPNSIYSFPEFILPVAEEPGSGLQFFEADAFKCCNHGKEVKAGLAIPKDQSSSEMGLGTDLGSGTHCCSLYDQNSYLFCDNWGEIPQYQDDCPRTPWRCWARASGDSDSFGDATLEDLEVYSEPLHEPLMMAVLAIMVTEAVVFVFGALVFSKNSLLRSGGKLVKGFFMKLASHAEARMQQRLTPEEAWQLDLDDDEPTEEDSGKDASRQSSKRRSSLRRVSLPGNSKISDQTQKSLDSTPEGVQVVGGDDSLSSDTSESSDDGHKVDRSPVSKKLREALGDVETQAETGSRPATRNLSSMMRPIVEPVKSRRLHSKKRGMDASYTSGFAPSATASSGFGFSTTSSWRQLKADASVRPLSASAIDSLARTTAGENFDVNSQVRGKGKGRSRGRGGPRSAWEQPRGKRSQADRQALGRSVQGPRLSLESLELPGSFQ